MTETINNIGMSMNSEELQTLLEILRRYGVTGYKYHFKDEDLELVLAPRAVLSTTRDAPSSSPHPSPGTMAPPARPPVPEELIEAGLDAETVALLTEHMGG